MGEAGEIRFIKDEQEGAKGVKLVAKVKQHVEEQKNHLDSPAARRRLRRKIGKEKKKEGSSKGGRGKGK